MKRVLIWKKVFPGSEYDIFNPTDYVDLYRHIREEWNGFGQNWGNRLWFQGLYSAINTGENEYCFLSENGEINVDEINNSFDFILLPMANIFYKGFVGSMNALTEIFEKITIPIYVVVCGVQADSYDDLNNIISEIGEESKRFIKAIYNTGGEFALRGYFTKEFFDRLGFYSAVVTGCPSLYQMGANFKVNDHIVEDTPLKPVFNGFVEPYKNLLKKYKDSTFIDQCDYVFSLFQPDYLKNANFKFEIEFVRRFGKYAAHLLAEERVVMIADMNDWRCYLKNNNVNYSFGSRIHGTIMALLSGVPSTIICNDSRTREMAEFFEIPNLVVDRKHIFSDKEFNELYHQMDYTAFNCNFQKKYNSFEQFLKSKGIVSSINENNQFFKDEGNTNFQKEIRNKDAFSSFAKKLDKHAPILYVGDKLLRILERIN